MNGLKLIIVFLLLYASSSAENETGAEIAQRWEFLTRVTVTGYSHNSQPDGFTTYSGIALEAVISRIIKGGISAELSFRTESRELDFETETGMVIPQGSIELLPLNLLFQFTPDLDGRLHPYAGLGVSLNVPWEKSGVLDSLDINTHLGPAVQLGLDVDLDQKVLLNFDIRWNTLKHEIRIEGERFADIEIDPLTLGAGFGFAF